MSGPPATAGTEEVPVELAFRLAERSKRLQARRFELLPLTGPESPFTEPQGRLPGESTSPHGLQELISSIATLGVLQPILVEETSSGERRLVAGSRRLAAARWLAANHPDHPHAESIPAVVCDGPLSVEERRIWQLIENLAREDLQPGELAAALLYERCALLAGKLVARGVAIPGEIAALEDPAARFAALNRLRTRAGLDQLGAPWREVLARLGLQLSVHTAKQLAAAFRALPSELSADLDENDIALHTRIKFLQLHRGRKDAAEQLWAAVRESGRTELLTATVREAIEHPDAEPTELIEVAAALHEEANRRRSRALRGGSEVAAERDDEAAPVDEEVVEAARAAHRALLVQLRAGRELVGYHAGSLRLTLDELASYLEPDGQA